MPPASATNCIGSRCLEAKAAWSSSESLRDADDLGAGVDEVLVGVAEGARLDGAAGRVVLRVEEEDDVLLAAIVRQRDLAALERRQAEVGGVVADLDASS